MPTATVDNVMTALEEASQSVPSKQDGWATPEQVTRVGRLLVRTPAVTKQKLDILVTEGRAEQKMIRGTQIPDNLYRPTKGGGSGHGILDTRVPGYVPPEGSGRTPGSGPTPTNPGGGILSNFPAGGTPTPSPIPNITTGITRGAVDSLM